MTGCTIMGYYNGNKVVWNGEEWLYEDETNTSEPRPCPKCNKLPTKEGHDACLNELAGVRAACCGHGVTEGYVFFENGWTLRGEWEEPDNNSLIDMHTGGVPKPKGVPA